MHIDRVLTRTVANGAPTVANDALLYMNRMFKLAVRKVVIESWRQHYNEVRHSSL